MYEPKKIGKAFTSKFVGTGPSFYEKRIYRAAVSQRLRNTALNEAGHSSKCKRHIKVMKLGVCISSRGVGLRLYACWDCGPESCWVLECLSLVSVVLLDTGLCNGQVTCLEESYQVWCVRV